MELYMKKNNTRDIKKVPSVERMDKNYIVDVDAGTITWHTVPLRGAALAKVGKECGTINNQNYKVIIVDGKYYLLHRVIYFYAHPNEDQSKLIDHIDGNRLNNKISNLRLVDQSKNMTNINKLTCKNVSGVRGVSKHQNGWSAEFTYNKKRYRKFFNDEDMDRAVEWIKNKRLEVCKEYSGSV